MGPLGRKIILYIVFLSLSGESLELFPISPYLLGTSGFKLADSERDRLINVLYELSLEKSKQEQVGWSDSNGVSSSWRLFSPQRRSARENFKQTSFIFLTFSVAKTSFLFDKK